MGSLQCGILVWLMTARCHSRRFWHVRGTSAYPPLATDPKSAASFFRLYAPQQNSRLFDHGCVSDAGSHTPAAPPQGQ